MQKIIYHLHDVCCNHSALSLDDAVEYAIKHGYTALYWTEHCPVSVECGYQKRRPTFAQLTDLKNRMIAYNQKYKDKLHVYFGYEVEFNKPNRWYFEKLARDPLCDYLIMGIHFYDDIFTHPWPYDYTINHTFTPKRIKQYLEMSHSAMKSGLFSWAPHPEIWLNSYCKWDKYAIDASQQIIDMAIKTKTPLGFNINFKKYSTKTEWHYPSKYFWDLVARTNVLVIVESDAHHIEKITTKWIARGRKMASSWGVDKNIVDQIPIKWLPKKPLLVLYEGNLNKQINPKLLKQLEINNVPVVKITDKTNLVSICKKHKVHPVWTLGLIKNTRLLAKAKKTSMFIISNAKDSDLSLKEFNHMDYDKFLKSFIKEIK